MEKKYRVSIFTDSIQIGGGPAGYVYNLKDGLEKLKTDTSKICVEIVTFNTTLYPKKKGIFEVIQKFRRRFDIHILRALKRYIALFNSDFIVFQGYQNPKFMIKAHRKGIKTAYMPHSPTIVADEFKMNFELAGKKISQQLYEKHLNQEETLFKNSDILFFPCENAMVSYRKQWNEIIKQKILYFIKSGTIVRDSSDFDKYKVKQENKFIVGFVGRYVTHKGYDVFADSAKKNKDESIFFVSAGAGPLKNSFVADFGFISDIGSFIRQCDVIVIPNKVTYYDLLPIECAAYGKPLIMSNVGGNIDQSQDFSDSILFESENSDDLLEKIELIRQEILKNEILGSVNKAIYEKEFTTTEFAKRWINAFKKIAGISL